MEQQKKGGHVLVIPYPAQGHMIPLLDLARELSTRGLQITVLVTPKNLPLLDPLLPSVNALVLPFPAHPSIPAGVENVKELPPTGFRTMMFTLTRLHRPVKDWLESHPSPPTAVIFDMFMGWANALPVPGYVFSPSGALAFSVITALWRDLPAESDVVCFPGILNRPSYPWSQISPVYRSYAGRSTDDDPVSQATKANFVGCLNSHGCVINTFSKLEQVYLDHLKQVSGHDRVWAVGPVLPPPQDQDQAVLRWLDDVKKPNSVVYVCFGSQAELSDEQMEALIVGLEKSGVVFILAVKGHGGLEERAGGRGVVIKGWAPQVQILRHPCVGAFLTHCGWNSVIEGILAGVPMLAWPMSADQFSNATLIVDEMKVGSRVCEGDDTVPDPDHLAAVLGRAIAEFDLERNKALFLQKAAMDAVGPGGTSFLALASLALHFSDAPSSISG